MTLAPRAVLVHRTTEYEELIARHGTHGQAAFFLSSRGREIDEVAGRHRRAQRALADVAAAVPLRWRTARVERADLDRFLFGPEDVVVVVGQDGLVANAAKYLSGQPVVGVDTEPGRNPGVLVRHRASDAAKLLPHAAAGAAGADELTMVEAVTDDGQRLSALNEIYVGAAGHQTARYRLSSGAAPEGAEAQASSGWWSAPARAPPAGWGHCGGRPGAAARARRNRTRRACCGSYGRPGRPPRPAPPWSTAN
ncbi:inorganic polyphosphate kinase [Streptomyces alboflavus]|uniref:Inorganic polyphosphate kinase n=1 Tax=Streptomyces alboflavus TaxID=67267 RepID=A0A1Z1WNN6_9ACTN|nr:inorganic polyphosphate kinase [Streptomyces alboflavus]